jgi:S1-C subfamily serine protease
MKKTISIIINVFLIGILIGQISPNAEKKAFFLKYAHNENTIIEYLNNNDNLNLIEGIWSFDMTVKAFGKISKLENYQTVAIIKDFFRNESDFIEIFLDGSEDLMNKSGIFKYAIIGEFNKTAQAKIFQNRGYQGEVKMRGAPETTNFEIGTDGILRSSGSFRWYGFKISFDIKAIRIKKQTNPQKPIIPKQEDVKGSGFVLTKNGIIVTNYHVIEGAKSINIEIFKKGKLEKYNASILTYNIINDIAFLKIMDEKFDSFPSIPYEISTTAYLGQSVYTIGFPLTSIMGKNMKVTNGIINAKSGIMDDNTVYQISVPIQPGNSGGALFNEDGNVIGITTSQLNLDIIETNVENVNYAVKSDYIIALASKAGIIEQLPKTNLVQTKRISEQILILEEFVCIVSAKI